MSTSVLEVAEAIYQKARSLTPCKTPAALDDLHPQAQRRYLAMAEAAIEVIESPSTTSGEEPK